MSRPESEGYAVERNEAAMERLLAKLGPDWDMVVAAVLNALHRDPMPEPEAPPKTEAELARERALAEALQDIADRYPDRFSGARS